MLPSSQPLSSLAGDARGSRPLRARQTDDRLLSTIGHAHRQILRQARAHVINRTLPEGGKPELRNPDDRNAHTRLLALARDLRAATSCAVCKLADRRGTRQ